LEAAVYIDEKGKAQSAYEFRFIADESNRQQLSNSWYDLVSWFMENDPSPFNAESHPHGYTGAQLPEPVTFAPYTFKGYTSATTGYKPANPILKGLTISTYANKEYTHDTYEYRMAKLLNSCEDHLIMDAVVYHYLFIERHTMIDNVAKNTYGFNLVCECIAAERISRDDVVSGEGKFVAAERCIVGAIFKAALIEHIHDSDIRR
jgi:hypothetical protein